MNPKTRAKIQEAHRAISRHINNGSPLPPDGDTYYAASDGLDYIIATLAAEPDEPTAKRNCVSCEYYACEDCDPKPTVSKSTRDLIEHCAAIAVSYMEETDDWTGKAADSGHLRHAILDADYSEWLPTVSKSVEELVDALAIDAFDEWAWNREEGRYMGAFDKDEASTLTQQFLDAQIAERDKTIERLEGKVKELLDEPDDDF